MADPEPLRLQVLGPLRVWRGGVELDPGPRQQRCLLALLLARGGHPISMTELTALIWGSDPPSSAANVIHKYVGILRRLLEPGLPTRTSGSFLLRNGNGYRLVAGPETLDLAAFRHEVAAARENPRDALDLYAAALRLCRGSAGESLAETAGATAIFAGLDSEFFEAAVAAAELAERAGQPARVVAPLQLAAAMNPLNEQVHASLVTLLAAAGRQADGLAVYRAIRERLADELGIDPGPALQDAHQRVLTRSGLPLLRINDGVTLVPLVRPAQLPPDLSLFVGRAAELAELDELAAGLGDGTRTGPLVVAMDGMGGVGKSTLAAHFARRVAESFTDGQLYLDLQGEQSDALLSLLYTLGVPASHVPGTADARIGVYRSLTAGKRLLVLLDNVRDPAQVRPLLPNSAGSLVLVTSRRPLVELAASDGAHLMRLDLPDRQAAGELLERRLSGTPDRAVIDEIVELCGRLPLALAVLAARLAARPALSLAAVAADLRAGTRPLEAFAWSYRQLSEGAARLFRLLAVTLSPGVTEAAAAGLSGRDPARTRAELAELTEAALVTEHTDGRFTSHVLVKAYAEELLDQDGAPDERRAAVTRLLQYYLHSSFNAQVVLQPHRLPITPDPAPPGVGPEKPGTYAEAIAWFATQREVLREAVRVAAGLGYGIVPWQLAITMQQYLQWAGLFQDWDDIMRWALRAARAAGDEVGEAHTLRSLAGARWSAGANEEALDLLTAALRIYRNRDMGLEQALVHTNLHWVYEALGRDEEALAHSEEALLHYREIGYRRAETMSLMSTGRSLARLGQLAESSRVLEQVLVLHEEIRNELEAGWDATLIAVEGETRMAIASNLAQTGRIEEAAEQLELSARTSGRVNQRPNQFEALRRLAELLLSAGKTDEAYEVVERARAVLAGFPGGGPATLRERLRDLERA